ncbi:tripartite tricarboxylate transporter TctB family protein [Marinivivus vitaminiproducens]|uniref:tripartite tricarboxylate transporter TctB family protein n=1 Tax=Marinivivus vitaminiproducens TaxID=3035935 RepID=UPI00279A8458|nr:tripartite tricarboxylate transporter TctB family protein [Geminicoccaceae bacterium SCSIO 64248]
MTKPTPFHDLATGLACLVGVLIFFYATVEYPRTALAFPRIIVTYIIAPIGLVLILKGALTAWRDGLASDGGDDEASMMVRFTPLTLATIAAVVAGTLAIHVAGFLPAMVALTLVLAAIFRSRPASAVVYAIGVALVLWAFLQAFSIQMPIGPLGL